MSGPLTRQEASRLLGVPTTASDQVIKQAYRRLVREHHPDRGGDPGAFDRLQRAYERLVAADTPAAPSVARGRP
jgi:curved DNA-binding protein CbpA